MTFDRSVLLGVHLRIEVHPFEHEIPQFGHHRQVGGVHRHLAGGMGGLHHGGDHGVDPLPGGGAEAGQYPGRDVVVFQYSGPECVGHVVGQVGDPVGVPAQEPFGRY
jgi:hypothetical protein